MRAKDSRDTWSRADGSQLARESNARATDPRTRKVVSLSGTRTKAKATARMFLEKDPTGVVASVGTVARMATWSGIVCG